VKENEVKIKNSSYGIYGIGYTDKISKKMLVEYGIPGDLVIVKEKDEKSSYTFAKIKKIVEKSSYRDRRVFCPHFWKCGGCTYGDISYKNQVKIKNDLLNEMLKREGLKIEQTAFIPSEKELGYRLRTKLKINRDGFLSYSKLRSNKLVAINNCPVDTDGINKVIKRFNAIVEKSGRLSKRLKEVEIVEGDNGIGIHFFIYGANADIKKRVTKIIKQLGVISFVISDLEKANFVVGGRKLIKNIGEKEFKFYPASFFQANGDIAYKIAETIKNYIELKDIGGKLLDLYAGIGFFSGYLQKYFNKITVVESSPYAINDIRGTLKDHKDVSYYEKSVASALTYINAAKARPDLVILDPPRTNPKPYLFNNIKKLKSPYIVYVSCNPPALLSDLKLFINDYYIDSLIGFDMFPNTYHQEWVTFLRKKTNHSAPEHQKRR
jgi:23S rRNA (uracil1939-C5)-methyltransferase